LLADLGFAPINTIALAEAQIIVLYYVVVDVMACTSVRTCVSTTRSIKTFFLDRTSKVLSSQRFDDDPFLWRKTATR
jgi:hypothetical protein